MATATNRPAPSFAVAAIELLQSNSILEAAQLCASGVEHYPDYIGGYILLASAYESLGQHHDAQVIREALHARFPGLPILKSYAKVAYDVAPELGGIDESTEDLYTHDDNAPHIDEVVELLNEVIIEEHYTVEATENADPLTEDITESILEQSTQDEPDDVQVEDIYLDIVEAPNVAELVEVEVPVEVAEPVQVDAYVSHPNVLRLIEMAPVTTDNRIIRSASVRLIPGLEFTSLRFEGIRSRGRREITSLLDPPAFRTFHQMMRRPARTPDASETRKKPVTLEELAARLTDARLPKAPAVEQEISKEDFSAQQSPIMITETIARIYMQQGSYELAIEAFKNLQQQKPEKHDEFDKLIKECERKRT